MAIETSQIAVNRYAPGESQAVNLYSTETAGGLTLAQLIAAVCIRTAGALEEQSVNKMNMMSVGTAMLEKAADFMRQIAEETMADWRTAKSYLSGTVGVSGLPDNLDDYESRIQAATAIKQRLEILTRQAQEDMIDMQTLINRRDMTFNTSSNIVKAIGNSKANAATKMV